MSLAESLTCSGSLRRRRVDTVTIFRQLRSHKSQIPKLSAFAIILPHPKSSTTQKKKSNWKMQNSPGINQPTLPPPPPAPKKRCYAAEFAQLWFLHLWFLITKSEKIHWPQLLRVDEWSKTSKCHSYQLKKTCFKHTHKLLNTTGF